MERGPPCTSVVQKDIITRLQGSAQACGPVIEEQATAACQQRTSSLQLWWQDMGILYRLTPFGGGPRGAVARNDVMLRPIPETHALSHPCKWCLFANLACRSSGIRFPSSLFDLSSKEATQSLAPLFLGCLAQATLDCVLTTVIWKNLCKQTRH